MRRIGLVLASAVLIAAPVAAAAAGHHLKLKGVVVGSAMFKGVPAAKISVKDGSKKVGTMTIAPGNCAIDECVQSGTSDLKIGKVKGKALVHLIFKTHFPNPPTSGNGTISANGKSEKIHVDGDGVPQNKGQKFTFVISY